MALKPLNSVAGFSVGETPANVILANGDITTNNFTTTGVANLNNIGNVKISGGSNGQVISTDGSGNLSFITVSTTSLSNGNSNVQVLANGNITFSVAGSSNVVVITGTGLDISGTLSSSGNANVDYYLLQHLLMECFLQYYLLEYRKISTTTLKYICINLSTYTQCSKCT